MNIFTTIIDKSEKLAAIGSIVTFSIMTLMGILQVLFRYVLDSSLYFSEELARFMFVWSVFLASAVCFRKKSHAAIELFVSWMPEKVRSMVLVIASLCSLSFFALIIVKGIEITQVTQGQVSTALEVPMSYVYAAIPVGGLLMFLYTIEELITQVVNSKKKPEVQGEVHQC
ncbi:MAG: putative 2,3-diketo-L-gulonate transporter small permease protein YiaM [Peptococcaceae bacterium]|nr:putative 2,3-diketo-L-gulonate transporter small permease protein YiaM [Peptococcaceae bacterium]